MTTPLIMTVAEFTSLPRGPTGDIENLSDFDVWSRLSRAMILTLTWSNRALYHALKCRALELEG